MKKLFILISLLAVALPSAFAQTEIDVRGSGKLFPIAVPQLCLQSGVSEAQTEIPRVLARDLELSGYFEVLNPNSYIEAPGKCAAPNSFAYSDWSVIGAEGLVRGVVTAKENSVRIQLFLHDVQRQSAVLGKEYEGDASQLPKIAHRFANDIMKFFTGETGVFGSQIAFSSRVGRFKELFVMDMDGGNVRQLTDDRGLAVSASWDPWGKNLVYTSYRNRVPDLFTIDVGSRAVEQLTRTDALEIGAHYSKQGGKILASRMAGDRSSILLLNQDGSVYQKLVESSGIEVSANWSPNNDKIVFVSNRGGGPQIYVMDAGGNNPQRISFVSSNYCTSPAWSPKGDRIAFVCRADGGFNIFTSNPDGTDAQQLTSSGSNEDPDWSPDGRYIVFSSTAGRGVFNLALMRADGSNIRKLTNSRGGDFEPTWGPVPQ